MNKIGLAAIFCTVLFAIAAVAQTAQPGAGQMGSPSQQRPQMTPPSQLPDQSAQPGQSAPQPSQGRMSNIDDQVKTLSDQLNLKPDQQSKIKSILTDQHDQAMTIIQDNSMARDDKMNKIHTLRAGTIAKVRQLLTPDQQTKFDAMVQQQDDHIRQRQDQGGNSGSTGSSSPSGTSPSSTSPNTAPGSNPPGSTSPSSNPPSGSKPPR